MRRTAILALLASALLMAGCKSGGQKTAADTALAEEQAVQDVSAPADTSNVTNTPQNMEETKFRITTSKGTMVIKLYDETPLHKANFTKLASRRFYDGILFHRVINGFMIQGGDPFTKDQSKKNEWGTGGPGYTVPAEFVATLHHKKGAIAAARMGDFVNPEKESSGSQFYIVQSESGCRHLDGEYTVFGEVVSGLEVIDQIAGVATDRYDRPLEDVAIISVTPVK